MIRENELISLDTSVLVHWVRQDDTGILLRDNYHLHERVDRPIYSSTVEGEIRAIAMYRNWGAKKMEQLEEILAELVRVDAGLPDVVKTYADFYAAALIGGHGIGQNDLWIAAATKAAGAVLLTCDKDFNWMSPKLVVVEYVPTGRATGL